MRKSSARRGNARKDQEKRRAGLFQTKRRGKKGREIKEERMAAQGGKEKKMSRFFFEGRKRGRESRFGASGKRGEKGGERR